MEDGVAQGGDRTACDLFGWLVIKRQKMDARRELMR